ncbi:MAG: hypothetical protein U0904_06720 [Candidatus Nanopelagicales bacterium]|nr:hypothetical protein [Candidatus Nanopelagicales bacterium]
MNRSKRVIAATTVVSGLALAGCSTGAPGDADRISVVQGVDCRQTAPTGPGDPRGEINIITEIVGDYRSLKRLVSQSSAVVKGEYVRVLGPSPHPGPGSGSDFQAWEFHVSEVFGGSVPAEAILIRRLNRQRVYTDQEEATCVGDRAVVFLRSDGEYRSLPPYSVTGLDAGNVRIDSAGRLIPPPSYADTKLGDKIRSLGTPEALRTALTQ